MASEPVRLYTTNDLAAALRTSRGQVHRLVKRGDVEALGRTGAGVLIFTSTQLEDALRDTGKGERPRR